MKTIRIETKSAGQNFGCYAVLRDTRTGRKVAETETIRPYGFTASAYADGEALAEEKGWTIKETDE